MGDLDRAAPLLDALEPFLDRDIGLSERVWAQGLLAAGRLQQGRSAEARRAAEAATAASEDLAPVAVYCLEGYAGAAETLLSLAESGGSARSACRALDAYARVFPIAGPRALSCRARLLRLGGHARAALRLLRRAHRGAVDMRMPLDQGRILLALGRTLGEDSPQGLRPGRAAPPGRPGPAGARALRLRRSAASW